MTSLQFLEQHARVEGARLARWLAANSRSVSAAVLLALAGFGVTAFGVAPMDSDAPNIPQHLVTEVVATEPIQAQLDDLAAQGLSLYRSEVTRPTDTADTLLRRLGVVDPEVTRFLRKDPVARRLLEGRGGKAVRVQADERGMVKELIARSAINGGDLQGSHFARWTLRRVGGKLSATAESVPLEVQVRMGSGTIQSSLFGATDEARIPDSVAVQMAEVFAADIDFHRQIRKGDRFSVVYETLTADGEPITWASPTAGRLLGAEFVNAGRSHSAVWFRDGQGKGGYYGLDGQSKRRTFLASPMAFSRITSGFAMRVHPIMNDWRQHRGIDYGAPTGTAVRCVGDGVVEFAGWQNGYGNVVEVRHGGQRSTLYAHLSRIDVHRGTHVEQGQRLGAVGSTGWATGPHLHFELKLGGSQVDPLSLARQAESIPLPGTSRTEFALASQRIRSQLEVARDAGSVGASLE